MDETLQGLAARWRQWPERLGRLFAEEEAAEERAARLADLLSELTPAALVTGCRLEGSPPEGCYRWRDEAARKRWAAALTTAAPGLRLLTVRDIGPTAEECWLLVGLPAEAQEHYGPVETFLTLAASTLGLRFQLEAAGRQRQRQRHEGQEQEVFLTAGEAVGGLIHDLNNSLNSIVLQAAVVQMRVPEELRGALAAIRQEGARAAARMRPLQQFRQQSRGRRTFVDLNAVLAEVLEDGVREVEWGGEGPVTVAANPVMLKRLLLLLLRATGDGPVRVTSRHRDGQLQLSFDGADHFEAVGERVDLDQEQPERIDSLDRLAVKSLARLVGATVEAESHNGGGLSFTLAWPEGDSVLS